MKIETVHVTEIEQNCRILSLNGSALVIDPGEDKPVIEYLEKNGLKLEQIWLTHSHFDHCAGVSGVKEKFGGTYYAHVIERGMREHVAEICQMYGLNIHDPRCGEPDGYIEADDVLKFQGYDFKVLFTPGHSPGHVCFYCEKLGLCIAGDALFKDSIGRTDLPGGNHNTLINSIKDKLFTLPDDTKILPGHGPDTTIKSEKLSNPYLQGI